MRRVLTVRYVPAPRCPKRTTNRHVGWSSRLFVFALPWLACAAFWLVLVGSLDAAELWVGALVATIASIGSYAVTEGKIAIFHASPKWLALGFALPKAIVVDSVCVLRVLARRLAYGTPAPSRIRAIPFGVVDDDAVSAARRTLAIAYGTLPPNSIVLGIDRERKLLYLHQLEPAEVSPYLQKLGDARQ